jgi:hypothetical protein
MTRGDLYKMAKDACIEYEDGTLGVSECCALYCEDRNLSEELSQAMSEAYYYEEAIGHGIPRDLVEGKRKMSSQEKDYVKTLQADYDPRTEMEKARKLK